MTNLYKVICNWYDFDTDEEHKGDKCLMFASGMKEVGEKLEANFKYIDSVEIVEVCTDVQNDVLWLPQSTPWLNQIIEANIY